MLCCECCRWRRASSSGLVFALWGSCLCTDTEQSQPALSRPQRGSYLTKSLYFLSLSYILWRAVVILPYQNNLNDLPQCSLPAQITSRAANLCRHAASLPALTRHEQWWHQVAAEPQGQSNAKFLPHFFLIMFWIQCGVGITTTRVSNLMNINNWFAAR